MAASSGVGCRYGSDLPLLWLWRRPAAAALIRPLAWEFPCAASVALKSKKKLIAHNAKIDLGGGAILDITVGHSPSMDHSHSTCIDMKHQCSINIPWG